MLSAVENRFFQALADPSRRAIFESLTRGEVAVKDLPARFDISQPAALPPPAPPPGPRAARRHGTAGRHAAPRRSQRRRPRERSARGALRLLPSGATRNETAHRLD